MNASNVFGILLGAGSGARFGAPVPKAFVAIDDRSILHRSFDTLMEARCFKNIIVTVPSSERQHPECLKLEEKGAIVIPGGATRQQSVFLALRYLHANFNVEKLMSSYVLIHDAARCFVSADLVRKTADIVKTEIAVTTGVPSIDSLKRVDENGMVTESLRRSEIWCVQTPQAFRFDIIWNAHEDFTGEATDDASMVERTHPVKMIEGERSNIKVTTPEDLH